MNGRWNGQTLLLFKDNTLELTLQKHAELNSPADNIRQDLRKLIDFRRVLLEIPAGIFKGNQIEDRAVPVRKSLSANDVHSEIRKHARYFRKEPRPVCRHDEEIVNGAVFRHVHNHRAIRELS